MKQEKSSNKSNTSVIRQIVHEYRKANSFVITNPVSAKKILIDAGGPDIKLYKDIIRKEELLAIFLTHEHADHCLCVDSVSAYFDCPIFSSSQAAKNVRDSKQNFSNYIDEIPTFTVQSAIQSVYHGQQISLDRFNVVAYETPGHSPGSLCYFIDGSWFTGDTILNTTKTPLSFPHSNRNNYRESLLSLLPYFQKGHMIYPGHDAPFQYTNAEQLLKSIKQEILIPNIHGIN
jgi:glyoxylase-like metal-dependent hydrolase (beta-lactamase superfamily II)